jgi:MFS family permease
MGYVGEIVGKTKGLLITMTIAAWSALLSGVVPYGSPSAIYIIIIFFRFFLGVGTGGIYPLVAVKSVEDTDNAITDRVDWSSASWTVFW